MSQPFPAFYQPFRGPAEAQPNKALFLLTGRREISYSQTLGTVPGLTWEDAGPTFAYAALDRYAHQRVVSASWTTFSTPLGFYGPRSLQRALEAINGVTRKAGHAGVPADSSVTDSRRSSEGVEELTLCWFPGQG